MNKYKILKKANLNEKNNNDIFINKIHYQESDEKVFIENEDFYLFINFRIKNKINNNNDFELKKETDKFIKDYENFVGILPIAQEIYDAKLILQKKYGNLSLYFNLEQGTKNIQKEKDKIKKKLENFEKSKNKNFLLEEIIKETLNSGSHYIELKNQFILENKELLNFFINIFKKENKPKEITIKDIKNDIILNISHTYIVSETFKEEKLKEKEKLSELKENLDNEKDLNKKSNLKKEFFKLNFKIENEKPNGMYENLNFEETIKKYDEIIKFTFFYKNEKILSYYKNLTNNNFKLLFLNENNQFKNESEKLFYEII